MIVELGVGLLAIGAVGYAIHWQRERAKMDRLREEGLSRIKLLKEKIEGENE